MEFLDINQEIRTYLRINGQQPEINTVFRESSDRDGRKARIIPDADMGVDVTTSPCPFLSIYHHPKERKLCPSQLQSCPSPVSKASTAT